MANQVKRSKIANCLNNCGGYAGRLRRLWTEEKARDRSVPDGSDKHRQRRHWQLPLASNICGGHRWWTSVEREYEDENGDSSQKM